MMPIMAVISPSIRPEGGGFKVYAHVEFSVPWDTGLAWESKAKSGFVTPLSIESGADLGDVRQRLIERAIELGASHGLTLEPRNIAIDNMFHWALE